MAAAITESSVVSDWEDLAKDPKLTEVLNRVEAFPYEYEKKFKEVAKILKAQGGDFEKNIKDAAGFFEAHMSASERRNFEETKKRLDYEKQIKEALAKGELAQAEELWSKQKEELKKQEKADLERELKIQKAKDKHFNIEVARRKAEAEKELKELEERMRLEDDASEELQKKLQEAQAKFNEAQREEQKSELGKNILNNTIHLVSSIGSNAITQAESVVKNYAGNITSRLIGTGKNWTSISDMVASNLGKSELISTQKVLDNINTAVTAGIAYNVEQRAFLAAVKDEIVSTFDAFDSNLVRLIRIQNADSTAARLGLEATLEQQFNAWFEDTAYLSDAFDTASANLLEASSLLDRAASTEFEYSAQKWLGALYEAGASQNLISLISQGIGWLGSGNVSALVGNEQVNALMAMSAQRGGLNYASMLAEGLKSSDVNRLMSSMVSYLKEIADDTKQNNLLRSAFGNVFNLSVSDIQAVTNLNTEMMSNLLESNYSYNDLMQQTEFRLNTLSSILPDAFKLSTAMENLTLATGLNLMTDLNGAGYMGYKALDVLEKLTGGIKIPIPFTDIGTIEGLGKTAITGLGLLRTLMLSAGSDNLSLSNWNADDVRVLGGSGLDLARSSGSTSHAQYGSSKDVQDATVRGGIEESQSIRDEYTDAENQISMEDLFYGFFDDKGDQGILKKLYTLVSEGDALPVKLVADDSLYKVLKLDELNNLLSKTANGLGFGLINDENTIKNLLIKLSSAAKQGESEGSVLDVNVVDFQKGLMDFARVGAPVGGISAR